MSAARLSALIAGFQNLIVDLDGTVWVGETPTPRAADAIAALRAAGIALAFVTNEGRRSPEELVRKLWSVGATASATEVVTVGSALQYVLAEMPPGRGVFVIGSPAVIRHVTDAGHRVLNGLEDAARADVVVVVAHDAFDYSELATATRAVTGGATILAGGRDASYPTASGLAPGTGAIVAALEYATGAVARNVGKPDRQIFDVATDRLGPGRTLVVGDHLSSDLGGAAAAGLPAAIVLSGVTDRLAAGMARDPAPVAVAADLASLVLSA